MNLLKLTPIEKVDNIYLKREDKFEFAGCSGSKVRSALYIIEKAMKLGYKDFVSVGSRFSPQCEIISSICEKLDLKCYLFMPDATKDTSIIKNIKNNKNTTLIRELKQGAYTNVLISRAKKYAQDNNYYFINFGMEMQETIDIIAEQVKNIPNNIKRIIIPIGSGMNFCAVANGLIKYNRFDIQIIGISVGKDPMPIIFKYFPMFNFTEHKIIRVDYKYDTGIKETIGGIILDPIYEAKCKEYLQDGDLFWIVGKRKL